MLKSYLVEINDWTPDVIEYRQTSDQDWTRIDFPPQSYFFAFYDPAKGNLHPPISPWFYLSTDPQILSADEAQASYPDFADIVRMWHANGVSEFGKHSYSYGKRNGYRIIPLTEGSVLIDRETKKQVWPRPS